uniref:Retrovirus-related Pol polyprotein from transposon TNT 1-94 n=1 Tax=Cajanus cajan TaxID=3821 RepID=A0A151T974_CAJCA|nr:hypothetical protein KK1_018172 [Cajanus cajan]
MFYLFYFIFILLCEHVINFFYLCSITVVVASAVNLSTQINCIPMLNGTNFKVWKEAIEIILGCMDLALALRLEKPTPTPKNPNEDKVEKVEVNLENHRMCLMIMKRSVPEVFRDSIFESHNAKGFLDTIEKYFTSNEKADASSLLAKLISMRYKGKGNIREYIMGMFNLASKLKALKLELSDDLLVHLVLISLPTHFG